MIQKTVRIGLEDFNVYYEKIDGKFSIKKIHDVHGYVINMSVAEIQDKLITKITAKLEDEEEYYQNKY